MSENSILKRRWKLILNILTIVALVVLGFAVRHQLSQTIHNFGKVNLWALFLIIPIEIWNYDAQARLYKRLFGILGDKLDYKFLYKLSLELNFINNVFPSGGVSGISYLGVRMRPHGIRTGRATLIQIMKLALVFLSFEFMLIIGLLSLAISGEVNELVILVAGSLTTIMLAGTLLFTFIIGSRSRINSFFTLITRIINKFVQVILPEHPEVINIARARYVFDDLHENYMLFKSKYKELKAPFIYAFIANLTEVLAVYVIYVAFGHWVNIGAIILAYAVANFAGLVSVLPGGVGVYEALMTGVLVVAGIPAALSLPVIIMYRVVNTVLQIPPGYIFYHRTLSGNNKNDA